MFEIFEAYENLLAAQKEFCNNATQPNIAKCEALEEDLITKLRKYDNYLEKEYELNALHGEYKEADSAKKRRESLHKKFAVFF